MPEIKFLPNNLSLKLNKYDRDFSGDLTFKVALVSSPNETDIDYNITLESDQAIVLSTYSVNVESGPADVSVSLSSYGVDEGSFNLSVSASNSKSSEKTLPVNLLVVNDENTPDPPKEYAIKYLLEQIDPLGNTIICEIHQLGYVGTPVSIQGRITHKYQDRKDLFDPIISSSLKLDLESSLELTLNDLYSENEKDFKVFLKRNEQIIFVGFIKPDGIYEDYVYDRWVLSIDAYDGLSTLKDLSFVNENGVPYKSKYSGLQIITNCLKRTGLNLHLNINCEVFYRDLDGAENSDSLDVSFFNTDRYLQSNSEPMDCESVVKSILQVFNAAIIQMNGEWWIYRPVDVKNIIIFLRYNNALIEGSFSYFPSQTIGSHIDGFQNFHCNANQRKSIAASVQAYRITYQYGASNSVFKNPDLKLEGTGLDIPGWTVSNPDGRVFRNGTGYGVYSSIWDLDNGLLPDLLTLNQNVNVNEGDILKLIIKFSNFGRLSRGMYYSVGVGGLWLQNNGSWSAFQDVFFVNNSKIKEPVLPILEGLGEATLETTIKSPEDGTLKIVIRRSGSYGASNYPNSTFSVDKVVLSGTTNGDVKGIEYTGRRKSNTSTVTKPNITVYNGDSVSDLFVGTIYKTDGETPTEQWTRAGIQEFKDLLEINAEDNLRISPRPMIVFEGDVYGYLPYLSLISINNFEGKNFQVMSYEYDFSTCVLKLSSKEFSREMLDPSDFKVGIEYNYGNETKVTIV